jgi:hypothetical protein
MGDDENQMTIPIQHGSYAAMFDRANGFPVLLIDYGFKIEFVVGDQLHAPEDAYEFAMSLAYAALTFATRCRYLQYARTSRQQYPRRTGPG